MASEAYDTAEDYFKDEDYLTAATHYDRAVELAPSNARYLSDRANNSIKLKRYESALADTRAAMALGASAGRSLLREGVCLFYLDDFLSAISSFEAAKAAGQDKTEMWIRKCNAEVARLKEKPNIITATPATPIVVHRIEALPTPTPAPAQPNQAEKEKEKPAAPMPKPPANIAERTREQWFQTPTDVTITLLAKNLTPDQVSVSLDSSASSLKASLTFPTDGSKFEREWKLWGTVTGHTMAITPYKVELVLSKSGSATWDSLERQSDAAPSAAATIVKRENVMRDDINYAAYPTSAKTIKNWEEVEKSAQQAEAEEKPEGEAALQKLFQGIYGNADEDTRRAMIKSFQTSGGTVLSTNWKEVKEKNYADEREAPKGQEMVDWNSRDRGAQ